MTPFLIVSVAWFVVSLLGDILVMADAEKKRTRSEMITRCVLLVFRVLMAAAAARLLMS